MLIHSTCWSTLSIFAHALKWHARMSWSDKNNAECQLIHSTCRQHAWQSLALAYSGGSVAGRYTTGTGLQKMYVQIFMSVLVKQISCMVQMKVMVFQLAWSSSSVEETDGLPMSSSQLASNRSSAALLA